VKEWKGEVVFLHEVAPGAADRSYGIHVAKLAGLPQPVIARAEHVLKMLEETQGEKVASKLGDDLPLFSQPRPAAHQQASKVETLLADIHPDSMTPKEALEWLYKLKEQH